jgi:hypothetical protein
VRYDRLEREVFPQLVALELVDQDAARAVDDALVGGGDEHVRHREPQIVVLCRPVTAQQARAVDHAVHGVGVDDHVGENLQVLLLVLE